MRSRRKPRRLDQAALAGALVLALAASPAAARKHSVPVPRPNPHAVKAAHDRAAKPSRDLASGIDLSRAVPMRELLHRPSTAQQYRTLSTQIAKDKPLVDSARTQSETLAHEAQALQRKLVRTAARVERLEQEQVALDAQVAQLTMRNERLSASFARDRVQATRLIAVLQRLQIDMPPAMAVRPGDALAAARSAMLIGASLPEVYGQAAGLARRIDALRKTRTALVTRRAAAARNAAQLAVARTNIDRLLAMKRREAGAAATRYGDLKEKIDKIAARAVNLQALLQKVAQLRSVPVSKGVVTVTAGGRRHARLGRGSLLRPVVGTLSEAGFDGMGGRTAPGLTYITDSGAQVISPADGQVIFAEPYHGSGQVLILEMAGGYHVVLAGLDRLDVRTGDRVLAGEPVGVMSKSNRRRRLYFELRQNGRGMSPAPYMAAALRKAN